MLAGLGELCSEAEVGRRHWHHLQGPPPRRFAAADRSPLRGTAPSLPRWPPAQVRKETRAMRALTRNIISPMVLPFAGSNLETAHVSPLHQKRIDKIHPVLYSLAYIGVIWALPCPQYTTSPQKRREPRQQTLSASTLKV